MSEEQELPYYSDTLSNYERSIAESLSEYMPSYSDVYSGINLFNTKGLAVPASTAILGGLAGYFLSSKDKSTGKKKNLLKNILFSSGLGAVAGMAIKPTLFNNHIKRRNRALDKDIRSETERVMRSVPSYKDTGSAVINGADLELIDDPYTYGRSNDKKIVRDSIPHDASVDASYARLSNKYSTDTRSLYYRPIIKSERINTRGLLVPGLAALLGVMAAPDAIPLDTTGDGKWRSRLKRILRGCSMGSLGALAGIAAKGTARALNGASSPDSPNYEAHHWYNPVFNSKTML